MGDHPMTVAHLLWQADAATLDRALAGCWDGMLDRVLDEHHPDADVAAVAAVLDRYVRDLVVEQVGHRLDELRVRLGPVLP